MGEGPEARESPGAASSEKEPSRMERLGERTPQKEGAARGPSSSCGAKSGRSEEEAVVGHPQTSAGQKGLDTWSSRGRCLAALRARQLKPEGQRGLQAGEWWRAEPVDVSGQELEANPGQKQGGGASQLEGLG